MCLAERKKRQKTKTQTRFRTRTAAGPSIHPTPQTNAQTDTQTGGPPNACGCLRLPLPMEGLVPLRNDEADCWPCMTTATSTATLHMFQADRPPRFVDHDKLTGRHQTWGAANHGLASLVMMLTGLSETSAPLSGVTAHCKWNKTDMDLFKFEELNIITVLKFG